MSKDAKYERVTYGIGKTFDLEGNEIETPPELREKLSSALELSMAETDEKYEAIARKRLKALRQSAKEISDSVLRETARKFHEFFSKN